MVSDDLWGWGGGERTEIQEGSDKVINTHTHTHTHGGIKS